MCVFVHTTHCAHAILAQLVSELLISLPLLLKIFFVHIIVSMHSCKYIKYRLYVQYITNRSQCFEEFWILLNHKARHQFIVLLPTCMGCDSSLFF